MHYRRICGAFICILILTGRLKMISSRSDHISDHKQLFLCLSFISGLYFTFPIPVISSFSHLMHMIPRFTFLCNTVPVQSAFIFKKHAGYLLTDCIFSCIIRLRYNIDWRVIYALKYTTCRMLRHNYSPN